MAYLLDANVFIEAKNRYYGMDFCPAFWDWVIAANHDGRVFSTESVGIELIRGDDELATWAAQRGAGFFLEPDATVVGALQTIKAWLNRQSYAQQVVDQFQNVADILIIAHALARQWSVVTNEIPAKSIKKVKIPDVCDGLGVRWIKPHEMLRGEKARFILGVTP